MQLLYVTGADCHLCDHGRDVLASLGLDTREVDVDSADGFALAQRGIPLSFLPVLTDGERVLAYGRLSEKRLRKDLGL
ncbi:MAG TPA: hypothetical protein VLN26_00365 [Gaiellaceae bacterium]|nr:hypothetical protein [Gaiellaceae bacterium]